MLQMWFVIQYQNVKECKALKAKCSYCSKIGHFNKVSPQENVNHVDNTEDWRCHSGNNRNRDVPIKYLEHSTVKQSPKIYCCKKRFLEKLNHLVKILTDTRAKMSVCYKQQAKLSGIYDKMTILCRNTPI